tara:strand:- start:343 stop:1305 length:963 start_codon:yes stop_codon:yes gene_type:complete
MKNYNNIQKFFHDLVLRKKFINKSLYEIEKIIYLKNLKIRNQQHIFISALPRSGTTSLLNFLFLSKEFASLTYQNMPFLLSPHFSKLLYYGKDNSKKKERLHGDGIMYDINSPEALDEVFFKNNEKFIERELENYIQLILSSENKNKYLSKNNLNYKRIDLINSILPQSKFLITIREPLQHAYSLFNQHLHFSNLQKKDDFIRRYMNYLGHNEFGINHLPWHNPINHHDIYKIDYWIEQWTLFYKDIFEKYNSYQNCNFVIYEELANPDYIKKFLEKLSLNKNENLNLNYFKNLNKKEINVEYDNDNYKRAKKIYQKFLN